MWNKHGTFTSLDRNWGSREARVIYDCLRVSLAEVSAPHTSTTFTNTDHIHYYSQIIRLLPSLLKVMGSLLSILTPQTLALAIITVTCGPLTYRFILSNSTISGTQLASSASPQQNSAPKVTGSKSKKKNRGAHNRKNVEGQVVGRGAPSQTEPPRDLTASGLGETSSKVERKVDPVITTSPHVIPGDLDVQTNASASASSIAKHGPQEPGVAPAKKGKKKKVKKSAVPSGTVADQDNHEDSRPRKSSVPPDLAGADNAFTISEPIPQSQIHPQPKHVKQVTLPQSEPPRLRSSPSFDTDSSWTRVEFHRPNRPESDGNADAHTVVVSTDLTSTSDVGGSIAGDAAVAENTQEETGGPTVRGDVDARLTLAEKLAPKLRPTGVEE